MRAIRVEEGKAAVAEVPDPEPQRDQALVKITAAGVCHSDLHILHGDWHGVTTPSLGHEAIGVVEALGPGAERFVELGQRVILGLGGAGGSYWCGACEYCLRGRTRHCIHGDSVMGTFAEKFAIWAPALVPLPDEVPDREAPLACGGLTAYSAVKKLVTHGVSPGSKVAVIGAAGGLGHYATQIASAFGYDVTGIDVGKERLDFVRSMGASKAIEPGDAEMSSVDAVLVFAARLSGFELGLQLVRPCGLFVAVGIPPTSEGPLQLDMFSFFYKEPTIIYSAVGTVEDMRELVELAARGKVKTHIGRTGGLSDLPVIFEELQAGAYVGRAVIDDMAG